MKGSVKVKFDLGWAMSAIVAIVLVVGSAARLSFTYSVQSRAEAYCMLNSQEAASAYTNSKVFTLENFLMACEVENIKPNFEVLMDFNAWTYNDVYPTLNRDGVFGAKNYSTKR